jgi:FtsP/CotA-like multicopper oxidase with cupredoxin domain
MITRRAFLSAMAVGSGSLLSGLIEPGRHFANDTPDVTLRIGRMQVEVARHRVVTTTAYNGSAPGPLTRLHEGIPATVEIFNDTEIPEYVHWHGLPVSAELDGTEEEQSLAVPPHGHLRYRLTPYAVGTRYVHSHVMAGHDLSRGVYSGQFAFVYVQPKNEPGNYDREIFLATHEWEPYFVDADEDDMGDKVEYKGETDWGPNFVEVGYRIGSINGKALGEGEPVRVRKGERVLFRILNASATENVRLSLPGHTFKVIALDGNPVPCPRSVGVLEIGVAERVDAVVEMANPGVWILGSTDDGVRGRGLGILVEYAGKSGIAKSSEPAGLGWDYRLFGEKRQAPEPDDVIPVVIDRIPPDPNGYERWAINGHSYDSTHEPKILKKGSRYRFVFDNRTGDAHPLHIHRNTFELTKVNGKPTAGVMKDVVLVKEYQTLEVDFIPQQEGLTLFHCHQQLHMDHGFKTLFDVR